MSSFSPMIQQYLEIKQEYEDCILFFRMGDFYEMFFEDAKEAARILDIALTGRASGKAEKAPMCGVPYHSASGYIKKLIEAGKKIAICEQVEDPKTAKGIVKREVVRVITPGTYIEEEILPSSRNNYILCCTLSNSRKVHEIACCYMDISAGEVNLHRVNKHDLLDEFAKVGATEVIYNPAFRMFLDSQDKTARALSKHLEYNRIVHDVRPDADPSVLSDYFSEERLKLISADGLRASLAVLLSYISDTQRIVGRNIHRITEQKQEDYMRLDAMSRRNLELVESAMTRDSKMSLFGVLDFSVTSMGSRCLRRWIESPLADPERIRKRLDLVEQMVQQFDWREELRLLLDGIYDLERLCAKLTYATVHPKEMIDLRSSIEHLPQLQELLRRHPSALISDEFQPDSLQDLFELLDAALLESPSLSVKEGDVFRPGYHAELDRYKDLEDNAAFYLQKMEIRERERLGTKNAKIGYNKVFGYYIEISKGSLKQVSIPEDYIRKQTLTNAERFISEELKDLEEKMLVARQKITQLQTDLFRELKDELNRNIIRIQTTSRVIGVLDAMQSLAHAASLYHYRKPRLNEDGVIRLTESRHPVVERVLKQEPFVPNDVTLNNEKNSMVITGPNMGGKSTYMRQVALICIMAHIGSFVPCEEADIALLDSVYTRIGATDDLSQGLSTFMVEMSEVSYILEHADKNSLVILDEIGRGTSTFDGLSLAWSIMEYMSKHIGCKVLFSTHYLELTELAELLPNVVNYTVAVEDTGADVKFLRKMIPGKADKSYGIHVAKLAELPNEILRSARKRVQALERDSGKKQSAQMTFIPYEEPQHIDEMSVEAPHPILARLQTIDMNDITPRHAFDLLEELVQESRKEP